MPGKSLAAIAGFVDLGKRLKDRLKALDAEGQIKFYSFGYDWRRSLELSSSVRTFWTPNTNIADYDSQEGAA